MQTFCTIITAEYLPFAKVLYASLKKYAPDISLQVLIVDENTFQSSGNFILHTIDAVTTSPVAKGIYKKYAHTNQNFRSALKPVFITYLLQNGFDKVIYADGDLYFVSNFYFLFDELDTNNILLTPHWANLNPLENEGSLKDLMRGGLYNAGFVGANKDGAVSLKWWAEMCHFKTEENLDLGLFFDQKYLDILPVQFENVKIIKHQGCNLASWNIETCKREIVDGKLAINKLFEPVFIHFAKETIVNILNNNDKLLAPFLNDYVSALQHENVDLLSNFSALDKKKYTSAFYKLKHRLRLRTRFKRLLFKLAEKL
jgi:lipopolysaccharide biosynthesis glycosyltransferase